MPQERFREAYAGVLARRLAGASVTPPPPPPPPGVAETCRQGPLPSPAGGDEAPLACLARQVVDTVLALAGRELRPEEVAEVCRRAAAEHLAAAGVAGGAASPLAVRLAAEVPRLLDLPRLAELAGRGLALSPAQAALPSPRGEIVGGQSPAFARALKDLARVAVTDLPVLLTGETGTGKEVLARRLHDLSPRRQGPFVPLNCAALAKQLWESELFGHVKGAFTGAATAKEGYLRAAAGGTLFLDEIGEASAAFQVRLLRVLEDRVVVPVGASRGVPVDFRLVAASHRDLEAAAARGAFHRALLHRIMVVPIHLPPLRERREDLPALIDHFLAQANLLAKRDRRLAPAARARLLGYAWPGNLRELANLLQRLVALSDGEEIGPELLPPGLRSPAGGSAELAARLARVAELPAARRAALAELLAGLGDAAFTNKDIRGGLNCSDSTAKNLLRALAAAGLLEVEGRRGGRRYRLKALPPVDGRPLAASVNRA